MDDELATSRACPYCLSEVPADAVRCRHCAGDLVAASDGPDLAGFWILGVILAVIGVAVSGSSDGGDGQWIGLIIAGVGGILLQIAVVAYGVSVGMRDRDHRRYVKRRTNADMARAE